jgi:cell division septation protein DedD
MSEHMSETQDTELTLSTGKLLFIFFSLVALCAVFFSLGYAVGRGNREGAPPITEASTTTPLAANSMKPAAGVGAPQPAVNSCPADTPNCVPAQPSGDKESSTSNELSFVKDKPADKVGNPNTSISSTTVDKKPSIGTDNAAPGINTVLPSTGVMVQVAAVSKQTDADALVNALRKKQYPVIVVNNVPGSTLFHVQVGPFAQLKDAEAMQKKLQADGYNAIIKK